MGRVETLKSEERRMKIVNGKWQMANYASLLREVSPQ
jgi:hypothetical protein